MLHFKYIIPVLVGMVALESCVLNPDPLDIDIPVPEQYPVVSSFLFPPQEVAVTLTRTFSALLGEDSVDLQNDDIARLVFIDSAEVTMTYGNRTVTLEGIAPGVYASFEVEQIYNERYTLRAKDLRTGKSITAETVLMPQVNLDTVYPVLTYLPNLNDTLASFEYTFTDVPGAENYYLATYTNIRELLNQASNPVSGLFNFNQTFFHVFTDQNNGDGKPITYKPDFAGVYGDTIVVALSSIPKEYYEFLSAYKKSGNLFSQLVGEPINLPTNVRGGYEYFAMIRPKPKAVILR